MNNIIRVSEEEGLVVNQMKYKQVNALRGSISEEESEVFKAFIKSERENWDRVLEEISSPVEESEEEMKKKKRVLEILRAMSIQDSGWLEKALERQRSRNVNINK